MPECCKFCDVENPEYCWKFKQCVQWRRWFAKTWEDIQQSTKALKTITD